MKSVKKYMEKEKNRQRKNPGKEQRAARKASQDQKRGGLIPAPKTIESGKQKAKARNKRKADLRKELSFAC